MERLVRFSQAVARQRLKLQLEGVEVIAMEGGQKNAADLIEVRSDSPPSTGVSAESSRGAVGMRRLGRER